MVYVFVPLLTTTVYIHCSYTAKLVVYKQLFIFLLYNHITSIQKKSSTGFLILLSNVANHRQNKVAEQSGAALFCPSAFALLAAVSLVSVTLEKETEAVT